MPDIIATSQQPYYGAVVRLFTLDNSSQGGDIFRFTNGPLGDEAVIFDGEPYAPVPCELSGLTWSGHGSIPTPTFEVSNIAGQFVTAVIGSDSLLGAKLTMVKTFEQFLDNGDNPDPTARFPEEVFFVDQLVSMDSETVVWRLAALFDLKGVKLPRRQILRDACTHRYRRYIDGSFDYSEATCPYVGATSYDLQNNTTTDANDKCALRLSSCRTRFGENGSLPFRGFPGAARIRNRV